MHVLSVATLFNGMPHVEVLISDTGGGMPEEKPDNITAKPGICLGLPISKKSMEDHGGSISVSSIVGEDSTFSPFLPLPGPGCKIEERCRNYARTDGEYF